MVSLRKAHLFFQKIRTGYCVFSKLNYINLLKSLIFFTLKLVLNHQDHYIINAIFYPLM